MLDAKATAEDLSALEVLTEQEQALNDINSTSKVSIWRLILWIIAYAMFNEERLWDIFKAEAEAEMAKQKVHSQEWYKQKALGFHFGVPVIPGTDQFNLEGLSNAQIVAAKKINQAACVKLVSANGYGILRIKVATSDNSGQLQPVPDNIFQALKHYILRYAVDGGTQVRVTTNPADDLKLHLEVYYDPLVMGPSGVNLLTGNETSVQDAINSYLQGIEFNGEFGRDDLVQKIRSVPGVKGARIVSAASKYGDFTYESVDVANAGPINEYRVADSGYMKLDMNVFNIQFIKKSE
jgi:hypothetical protein